MTAPIRWLVWNPLRLRGFALPEQLVFIAKFAALAAAGEAVFPLFLPFFPAMEWIVSPEQFALLSAVAWWAGYLTLFFTRFVRFACLTLGAMWIAGLLACQPCHSVAHTYLGCVLFLIGCSSHTTGPRLLQAQVVILYAGAALNKGLDPDWWNGRYFETLMVEHHRVAVYMTVAEWLPPMLLSRAMGIATIALQCMLAVCFSHRAWHHLGIGVGVLFHGAMILLMQMTFGPFFLVLLASYVAFVKLPAELTILRAQRWLLAPLLQLDPDGRFRDATAGQAGGMAVEPRGTLYSGWSAVQRLVLYQPLFWFLAILPLMSSRGGGMVRGLTIVGLILFLNPWLPKFWRSGGGSGCLSLKELKGADGA